MEGAAEEKQIRAQGYLARNVEAHGHLTTGFVGTPYLLQVLTAIGRLDLAKGYAQAILQGNPDPVTLLELSRRPLTAGSTRWMWKVP